MQKENILQFENDSMRKLAFSIRNSLRQHFGDAMSSFEVVEIRELDPPWLVCNFALYDYWRLSFSFDRGQFGFSIKQGDYSFSLANSYEEAWTLEDMSVTVKELDRRVRLRIPDKYLSWYETGKPPLSSDVPPTKRARQTERLRFRAETEASDG